jgi:hypothetical protein
MMRLDKIFSEPVLEFGNGGKSFDIREGILLHGPVDVGTPKAKTVVKLGFVGTPKTISAFCDWMDVCSRGVEGDDPLNTNFSPKFPGLSESLGFSCTFVTDTSWQSATPESCH